MGMLEVFDRPLCCSTGICGPSVDPALVHFAADLDWLKSQGVELHRYNLAFEPAAFTKYEQVKEALRVGQVACLPLLLKDGQIVSQGRYPARGELAAWFGMTDKQEPIATPAPCCQSGCC